MTDEDLAMIALLLYTDAGDRWRATVADVLERGSALDYLRTVVPADLMGDPTTELLERARQDTAAWSDLADLITVFDARYPSQLTDVHDLPPFLFTRGDLDGGGEDHRGVCLVGSRQASRPALDFSYQLASALAGEQVAVISGLAAGIDTAAHRGALDNSGRTVAVIGTGIDRFYPPQNRALQSEIEQRGLVISQFWPGSPPTKTSFPLRNATMSAYGGCTMVVAAGERSGARIQARQAIAHGRPLILSTDVASTTSWGRELASSAYDVNVVGSVDGALSVIGEILDRPTRVSQILHDLTG
ncbi:DNA-processing protein DprA [Kribbella sp. NPDC051718]|uniref:DNA-processing protein DprA n=1 Tax=Kribbella sp. NPDC051718 TaxID=3155168 RepID=UPI0034269016